MENIYSYKLICFLKYVLPIVINIETVFKEQNKTHFLRGGLKIHIRKNIDERKK